MDTLLPAGTTGDAGMAQAGATINAPKIEPDSKTLFSEVRAISSVEQVYTICETMFDPNSDRNVKNAIIAEQYNDSPPFPAGYLKQRGQKFRHNASTGFLSGILDPVITQPRDIVDQAQYLSSASLPERDDPGGAKTTAYRMRLTKTLRSWDGWDAHLDIIAQEDVVYGYAAAISDDPTDWRPEECRQDDFGVPDNTGQTAQKCQFFGRRKNWLIHELIKKIADEEAASAAGWKIENCIAALNEAMPEDRSTQDSSQGVSGRKLVDLVRDGNSGAAHDPKARTVNTFILYAVESTGKVSKFIVVQSSGNDTGKRLLYECFDEFESMDDIITLYSLNPGTGSLYSSKGGGRKLINLAKGAERNRNRGFDSGYLGSCVWLHSEKGMVSVQLKVFDQFAVIGSEAKVEKDAFPDRSEAFDHQDERFTRYAQQAFGQYVPSKMGEEQRGEKRTAREATIDYTREVQTRSSWLKRFLRQFGREVTMVAKKLCDKNSKDEVAKEFRRALIEDDRLTEEDIEALINQPQGQVIDDMTQQRTQVLVQMAPVMMQSPFFKKYEVQREISVRTLGLELTNRFMSPKGIDPIDEATGINKQILENSAMRTGESVNVVPTDNHKVHSSVILSDLQRSEPGIMQKAQAGMLDPAILDNVQTAIKHGEAHVQAGLQQAEADKSQDDAAFFQKHAQAYAGAQEKLDTAIKMMQQHKAAAPQPRVLPSPQAGGPAGQPGAAAPGAPAPTDDQRTFGGMTEKILVAWIGHFELLGTNQRNAVLRASGLPPLDPRDPQGITPPGAGSANNSALTQTGSEVIPAAA